MNALTGAWKLGAVFGIDIRLHFSVLFILLLIITSLGTGLLPEWHPEWRPLTTWSAAAASGVLFMVSLLAHELSHALTARNRGIETRCITLFLFGGLAEMGRDAQRPQDEFMIAAAGPAASLVLAALFFALARALSAGTLDMAEVEFARLDPVATVCLWLSAVNFMLGLFNLLPGFPLDGGRVFRALLWWWSGDMVQATRKAAGIGSLLGWMLVAWGVLRVLQGDLIGGLWLVFIGWFLHRLAEASATQILMARKLEGFDVADVMRTRFERVPLNISVREFVDDYVLRSTQILWPVEDGGRDVGYLTTDRLAGGEASLEQMMVPLPGDGMLSPDLDVNAALARLSNQVAPLPVVVGSRVVGIVHQADILRWLALHERYR
jgi:Zn-dependent protease